MLHIFCYVLNLTPSQYDCFGSSVVEFLLCSVSPVSVTAGHTQSKSPSAHLWLMWTFHLSRRCVHWCRLFSKITASCLFPLNCQNFPSAGFLAKRQAKHLRRPKQAANDERKCCDIWGYFLTSSQKPYFCSSFRECLRKRNLGFTERSHKNIFGGKILQFFRSLMKLVLFDLKKLCR